jgi:hypothetical protein
MGGARRSGRIAKEIPIVLLGTDTTGRVFSENTTTVVLSRHGTGIVARNRPDPDENLTIRLRGGNAEVAVRLVGEMGQDARGYICGVAFVDPDLDFWELKYPPPQRFRDADVAMECSICQTRDAVDQTEVEADVYVLASCILRFCPRCGTSTEWRRANGDAAKPAIARGVPTTVLPLQNQGHRQEISISPCSEPVQTPCTVYATGPFEFDDGRSGGTSALPDEAATPKILPQLALPPSATCVVARKSNRRRVRQYLKRRTIFSQPQVIHGRFNVRSRCSLFTGLACHLVAATIRHVEALNVGSLFRYGAACTRKRFGDAHLFES